MTLEAKATCHNGVLELTMPKNQQTIPLPTEVKHDNKAKKNRDNTKYKSKNTRTPRLQTKQSKELRSHKRKQ